MTYPSTAKTVLIGKESTWGTAVTTDKDIGIVQDITDGYVREVVEIMALGALDTQQIISNNFEPGGSMTYFFQNGRLLEHIFGSVAHVETTSDWKHTYTVSSTLTSFSLESSESGSTDTARVWEGCVAEKAEISIDQTNPVTVKFDWKGESVLSSATATAAVIDNLIVLPKSFVTITVGGVASAEIQDFTLTLARKLEKSPGIGSVLLQQLHPTELKYEFSGKVGFQSKTFQELGFGGTTPAEAPTGLAVIFDADNGVALGSGQRQLKISLADAVFNKQDVVATLGDLTFLDFAGNGTLTEAFSVDDISSAAWS